MVFQSAGEHPAAALGTPDDGGQVGRIMADLLSVAQSPQVDVGKQIGRENGQAGSRRGKGRRTSAGADNGDSLIHAPATSGRHGLHRPSNSAATFANVRADGPRHAGYCVNCWHQKTVPSGVR